MFFIRAWRWQCLNSDKSIQRCITSNAYWCLELNAHSLVQFLVNCRQNQGNEQFLVQNISSQPCETAFRELRSMTTMNHTAVNFTMKDVEQRIQKMQMKLLIAHRRKCTLSFPSLRKQVCKALAAPSYDLPNDDQIAESIKLAEQKATELLISVGFDEDKIDFTHSLTIRNSNVPYEFEFVNVNELYEDGTDGNYTD